MLLASALSLLTVVSWHFNWGGQPSAALTRLLKYLGASSAYVTQVSDWLNNSVRRDGIVSLMHWVLILLAMGLVVHISLCFTEDGPPLPEDFRAFGRRVMSTTASIWVAIAVLAECRAMSMSTVLGGLAVAVSFGCMASYFVVTLNMGFGLVPWLLGVVAAPVLVVIWLNVFPFLGPLIFIGALAGFRELLMRD